MKERVKKVFISSTAYDHEKEREQIRSLLEDYNRVPGIRFECLVSDHTDFLASAKDRAEKDSYDICLDNVARSDYFILLLKKRYGDAIIHNNGDLISITHMEFREARKRKIPRFVLIDKRTWDAKDSHRKSGTQSFITPKHLPIFHFIDEIRDKTKGKGNWIDFYKTHNDISEIIYNFLDNYDDSNFIGDITIPNGHRVYTGDSFIKTWEIENVGLTIWENRYLKEDNEGASGLIPDSNIVPIPRTLPGERVKISVHFTAPEIPATCDSYWKMVDEDGKYFFPHKVGLNCLVKVV